MEHSKNSYQGQDPEDRERDAAAGKSQVKDFKTEQEKRNKESAPAFAARDAELREQTGGAPGGEQQKPHSPPDELAKVEGPVNADGPAKNSRTVRPEDRERDDRPEAAQHGEPKV